MPSFFHCLVCALYLLKHRVRCKEGSFLYHGAASAMDKHDKKREAVSEKQTSEASFDYFSALAEMAFAYTRP